jgi:hypothetical protein
MSEPCHRPPASAVDDRGGIVLGWLTKITVVLAVCGVFLFDGISVLSTQATVSDQGSYAARAASTAWEQTHDLQKAYDAAVAAAFEENAQNVVATKGFTADADGTVHLVISREAETLLLYRWSRTAKWTHVTSHAQGLDVS